VYDQVKASPAPDTPIIWSEYNATYMNQQAVTDSAFMGPWLANDIRECDGMQTMMAYWSLSDVFEEQGVVKTPFYGGYGLVAERGIPKAAFRAFELLHRLGTERMANASENALVTKRGDGQIVIALWNYAEPGEAVSPKTFQLNIANAKLKKYRMQFVAPGSASALDAWKAMVSPALPTKEEIAKLVKASELLPARTYSISESVVLGPQSLAVLELSR
jgi:xylan 1,4-beta-xylosidase